MAKKVRSPLFLYHMHIPSSWSRYDYIDSTVVAAYSVEDAKTIPPNDSAEGTMCSSDIEFLKDNRLKIDLIGTAAKGVKRGTIVASFNAG